MYFLQWATDNETHLLRFRGDPSFLFLQSLKVLLIVSCYFFHKNSFGGNILNININKIFRITLALEECIATVTLGDSILKAAETC